MQSKSHLALAVLALSAGCVANTMSKPQSLLRGNGRDSNLSNAAMFWTRRSVRRSRALALRFDHTCSIRNLGARCPQLSVVTVRLAAIATGAESSKAKSFTIDAAVVIGPDGLSRFEELSRREAARTAILYAFDLIELDGEDLRRRPFLDRKASLAQMVGDLKAGILLNEHIAEDGPTVFAYACRLGAEGIVSKQVNGTGPCRVWIKDQGP
jgi:hypothetical protein